MEEPSLTHTNPLTHVAGRFLQHVCNHHMPTKRGRMPPTTGCLCSHASRRPTEHHISPRAPFRGINVHVHGMTKPSFGTRAEFVTTSASSPASPERRSLDRRSLQSLALETKPRTIVRARGDAALTDEGVLFQRESGTAPLHRTSSGSFIRWRKLVLSLYLCICCFHRGWVGAGLGGSVSPFFSRLTDICTDTPAFQQTGPFHITGVFKGLLKPLS